MSVDRTVKALLGAILFALVALWVQNARRDDANLDSARRLSPAPPSAAFTATAPPVLESPGSNPERALQQFGGALANPELPPEIRSWAATQVGGIGTPEAMEALIAVLDDPQIEVVRAAVDALAQRKDARVVEVLRALRAHPDPWVSRRVGEVLVTP